MGLGLGLGLGYELGMQCVINVHELFMRPFVAGGAE